VKLLGGAGVFVLLVLVFTGAARADDYTFAGQWRQTVSTAGRCDDCYIGIVMHGEVLTVTSNNGWEAVLNIQSLVGRDFAVGTGHWKATVGGAYGGKHFDIQLVRSGANLQMFMVVSQEKGAPISLRATFEKGRPLKNSRYVSPVEIYWI
jgi:hypothetical protein